MRECEPKEANIEISSWWAHFSRYMTKIGGKFSSTSCMLHHLNLSGKLFSHSSSSGVFSLPRTLLRCGKRPNLSTTSWKCNTKIILDVDCSQPSIFSYFYSIVERTDRGARNLARFARKPRPATPAYLTLTSLAFSFACVNRGYEQSILDYKLVIRFISNGSTLQMFLNGLS